jgi:outer membrane protein TolC
MAQAKQLSDDRHRAIATGRTFMIRLSLLLVLCLLGSNSLAEQPKAKGDLMLSEVLASAQIHHPFIAEAIALQEAAAGGLLSSEGGFDPAVTLKSRYYGSGYYRGSNSTAAMLTIPLETASTDLFVGARLGRGDFPIYEYEYKTLSDGEVSLGLRLALLRGNEIDQRRSEINLSGLQIKEQKAKQDSIRLTVLEEAALAYWDWSIALAQQGVFEDLLRVSERRQSQFEEQVRLGQLAAIDALDNSRTILSRRQKLLEQKQKTEKAAQKLVLFLRNDDGSPGNPKFIMTTQLPKIKKNIVDIITLIEKQLEYRPDIVSLSHELSQLNQGLKLAENSLLPSLNLETSLSRDYGEGESSRFGSEWKSMVSFQVPLYRREAQGKIKELEAKIRAKKEQIRFLKDEVMTLASAFSNVLELSNQRYNILEKEVDLSTHLEGAELDKFASGTSNLMLVAMREIATASVSAELLQTLLVNRAAYLKLIYLSTDEQNFYSR